MHIHPETQEGEVFLTNMNDRQFDMCDCISKRKGGIAYDGEGQKLYFKNWFPVFIQQRELAEQWVDLREFRTVLRERIKQQEKSYFIR